MHPKKVWKDCLNNFLIILILLIFSSNSYSDDERPLIPVPCKASDCNTKYPETFTHYKKAENSKDLLIYLPGGLGTRNLGMRFDVFPDTHLESLRDKIDLVFLASPYPMDHPKSVAKDRKSKDHYERIKSVVNFYKEKTGKRIWLSGCSLGTNSLGNFLSLPEHQSLIYGAVFMCTNFNVKFSAKTINMPILIIHHKKDACSSNPYSASTKLERIIKKRNSGDTTLIGIEGGTASGRDPCNGSKGPYHFFGSKAEEANNKILDYIAKH